MTDDQIITDVLDREKGWSDRPNDLGGPTMLGITKRTLEAYRGRQVTLAELRALTPEEARAIYRKVFVEAPGFMSVQDDRTRALLVDYGVNSSPKRATQALQRALGLDDDGIFGQRTKATLAKADRAFVYREVLVQRLLLLFSIVAANPSQMENAKGWARRWVSFL